MSKSKYCYIIINKENGNMMLSDSKLPFYWNRSVAKDRQFKFGNAYTVHKIELEAINKLILRSKRA